MCTAELLQYTPVPLYGCWGAAASKCADAMFCMCTCSNQGPIGL